VRRDPAPTGVTTKHRGIRQVESHQGGPAAGLAPGQFLRLLNHKLIVILTTRTDVVLMLATGRELMIKAGYPATGMFQPVEADET